jgi:hypothetical protein
MSGFTKKYLSAETNAYLKRRTLNVLKCQLIKEEGNKEIPEIPSRKRIKWQRESKNGLLLIYPLNHNCQYVVDSTTKPKTLQRKLISNVPIIGIAVSFPEIENDEKIEYAVNEQFRKEYEYPEELDQTDMNDGTD